MSGTAVAPFVRHERLRLEVKDVVQVTEENIGQLAALIGGQVDYSGDAPVLVVPATDPGTRDWRVQVGWQVSPLRGGLMNQNGFNGDGTWQPLPIEEQIEARLASAGFDEVVSSHVLKALEPLWRGGER